jgi:hypothetical protein
MKCQGNYDYYPDRCDECPRFMDDCDGAESGADAGIDACEKAAQAFRRWREVQNEV